LFYGLDPAAGIGGAHPNSDAARASFLAALDPGTIGVETFEGLPLGPVTGNLAFPPLGTTGSVVDLNSTAVQGAFDGANLLFAVTGSNYLRSVTVGTQSYFELTLSSPQNGVGFFGVGLSDFLGYGGFAPPIQITLDGGDPIDVLNVNPTGIPSYSINFFGVVSESPFTTVRLLNPFPSPAIGDGIAIDDLTIGRITAVPEPSSLMLAGCAALGALIASRRHRHVEKNKLSTARR
jgi:hypothetical protein